jgi:hypothetical protein
MDRSSRQTAPPPSNRSSRPYGQIPCAQSCGRPLRGYSYEAMIRAPEIAGKDQLIGFGRSSKLPCLYA